MAGNALAGDVSWSFTTTAGDITAPTVTAMTPANGASDVAIGTVVTATFSEALDPATVTGQTFELRDGTNTVVAASVSYAAATQTATLTPSAPLATLSTYTATLKGGATDPRVKDVAGNALAGDVSWSFTTASSGGGAPGLVAGYHFDEGSGSTVADSSGNDNTGTISGATWTTAGKFGNALVFNGTNNRVNVPDANSLDLTNGMTLEAWVYPTTLSGWNSVILKERGSNGLAYALYANDNGSRPSGYVRIGSDRSVRGNGALPLNTWTHLAVTYDGALLRLYQNGVEVGSRAQTGNISHVLTSAEIGGNTVWGEYFSGRIDEVRIYNRALTATEILTDMGSGG